LITWILFGDEYRSLSSLLCSLLHSHYLVPLGPKYSPQHPKSFHTHIHTHNNHLADYNKLMWGCNTMEYTTLYNQVINRSINYKRLDKCIASSMIFCCIPNLIQIYTTLWGMWRQYWIHSVLLKVDSCALACWSCPTLRPFTTSTTGLSTRKELKFHSWEVTTIHQWICQFLTVKNKNRLKQFENNLPSDPGLIHNDRAERITVGGVSYVRCHYHLTCLQLPTCLQWQ
jgi:hypothetical protein